MTFVATASGASLAGAEVLFADVEEDTANLDPAAVEAAVTDRTRVVAAVDYAGHPCDYDSSGRSPPRRARSLSRTRRTRSAAFYRGRPVGDLADVTTMSFFPTKNLTTGEGGAVVAKDPAVGRRAAEFHNIGLVRDPERFEITGEGPWHQEVHAFGLNYRLTDVACALGLSQLRRLAEFKQRRREIVDRYNAGLSDVEGVRTPISRGDVDPIWHLYAVRILDGRRREVYDHLRASGIGVQVNYLPVYWHPVYSRLGYRRGMCPVAEQFYAEQLSLPLFPGMADSDVDRVDRRTGVGTPRIGARLDADDFRWLPLLGFCEWLLPDVGVDRATRRDGRRAPSRLCTVEPGGDRAARSAWSGPPGPPGVSRVTQVGRLVGGEGQVLGVERRDPDPCTGRA